MDIKRRCLHQIFRPKGCHPAIKKDGWGECCLCEYNPKENPKCQGYAPVTFYTFVVEEKD